MTDIHPAAAALLGHFRYAHLPEELQTVAEHFYQVAGEMLRLQLRGPEATAGLRKLLEAKDCFVRAALERDAGMHR